MKLYDITSINNVKVLYQRKVGIGNVIDIEVIDGLEPDDLKKKPRKARTKHILDLYSLMNANQALVFYDKFSSTIVMGPNFSRIWIQNGKYTHRRKAVAHYQNVALVTFEARIPRDKYVQDHIDYEVEEASFNKYTHKSLHTMLDKTIREALEFSLKEVKDFLSVDTINSTVKVLNLINDEYLTVKDESHWNYYRIRQTEKGKVLKEINYFDNTHGQFDRLQQRQNCITMLKKYREGIEGAVHREIMSVLEQ